MRKKRDSFIEVIRMTHPSDVCLAASSNPIETWARNHQPLSLEGYQLALIRPKWADFRMERAFWSAMQQICVYASISKEKFVAVAMGQYPDYLPAAAVREGIMQYYHQLRVLPTETSASALSAELPATEPPTPGEAALGSCALHVLVVDDVAMNRDIAGSFLRAVGHTVTCVEGGAEAIAAIKTTDFDVVLMDVRMPEMDGLEATRRIRALAGARGRVPIVALTARAFTEQVAECRRAGMDSHVAKPFTPDTLLQAVLRAVGVEPANNKNVIRLKPVAAQSTPSRAATPATDLPAIDPGTAGVVDDDSGKIGQNEARTMLDAITRIGATSFDITWTTYVSMSLSKYDWTTSGRPGVHIRLEYTYWAALEKICTIEDLYVDAFIADAQKRYPDYAADIAARVAVATYFYEVSHSVSPACSNSVSTPSVSILSVFGLDRLVLDPIAFERTAYFLPSETVDAYVQAIAERAEALLADLRVRDASRTANELAEAANAIAGSAGMFGFDRLTHLGCCFEQAVESASADTPAFADGLEAALCDTLSVIQNRRMALAEV